MHFVPFATLTFVWLEGEGMMLIVIQTYQPLDYSRVIIVFIISYGDLMLS